MTMPQLNKLHWEMLCDPQEPNAPLLTNQNILFSRFLSSQVLDLEPGPLRTRSQLRALVVIANPSDLSAYAQGGQNLAPVDVGPELERAQRGLGHISLTSLESGGTATLDNMARHLRDGYDILYLVCHGALINDQPRLWLEKSTGDA